MHKKNKTRKKNKKKTSHGKTCIYLARWVDWTKANAQKRRGRFTSHASHQKHSFLSFYNTQYMEIQIQH